MHRKAVTALCALGIASLAACGARNAPMVPPASGTALPSKKAARVALRIKVPPRSHARAHAHRRGKRYVSPATASLAYSIDGGTPQTVAISTSNPDCSVVGAIGYLECTVDIAVAPGNHTFSFTAYDANNVALSANTAFSYDVQTGQSNQIPVTLGGVAASLTIVSSTGTQSGGFTIYGGSPQQFSVLPVDADGNFIIGPGAPQPSVVATPASMTLQSPSPAAPNTVTLTSTYVATDPSVPAKTTLSVTATPVPNSGGTTVTARAALTLYQPWIYVLDNISSNLGTPVYAFDDQGNPKTLAGNGGAPFPNLDSPYAMAYDSDNKLLYVASYDSSTVTAYDLQGNQQTLTGNAGNPFPNLSSPNSIAYDPHDKLLYVTNFNGGTGEVLVYDAQGNQQTVTGNWSGLKAPSAIAFDSNLNRLYVTNSQSFNCLAVTAYDEQGNQVSLGGVFPGIGGVTCGIGFDPHNDWLYITNSSQNVVTPYDEDGNAHTLDTPFEDLANPWSVAYYPGNLLYVASFGSNSVTAYDERGNEKILTGNSGMPFPNLHTPVSIVVVP